MTVTDAVKAVTDRAAAHKKAQDEYNKADVALVAAREVFVNATKALSDAEATLLKVARSAPASVPVVQPVPVVPVATSPVPVLPSGGKGHATRHARG